METFKFLLLGLAANPGELLGPGEGERDLLGEDLDAAALGVALALLALLDEHTVPGWLPALLDEQRCPPSGPVSFCFTEDHGAVPIGVVRSTPQRPMPLAHPRGHTSTSQPAASSSNPSDAEPATRRCTNTSCSSSSVCA